MAAMVPGTPVGRGPLGPRGGKLRPKGRGVLGISAQVHHGCGTPGRSARGPAAGGAPSAYLTALRALTSPAPNQLLWPAPPWHVCGCPPSTAGKKSYADVSLGQLSGVAPFWRAASRAPPRRPWALASSAATPAACGEAMEVPCA